MFYYNTEMLYISNYTVYKYDMPGTILSSGFQCSYFNIFPLFLGRREDEEEEGALERNN